MDYNKETKVLSDMDNRADTSLRGYITNLGIIVIGVIIIAVMGWVGNSLLELNKGYSKMSTDVQVIKEQIKYVQKYDYKFEQNNEAINEMKNEIRDIKSSLKYKGIR